MTVPAWPAWAEMSADYAFAAAEDCARAPFEDGALRQARIFTRPRIVREAKAEVPQARLAEMRAWIDTVGAGAFRWTDPADGSVHADARIVGGAGGAAWRQAAGRGGEPRWRADLRIETSLAGAASGTRSIWDAGVPPGDESGVLARRFGIGPLGEYSTLVDSRRPAKRWGALPAGWTETRPAYMALFRVISSSYRTIFRLSAGNPPDPWDFGTDDGPELVPAVARGLRLCVRCGGLEAAIGIGESPPVEPYDWIENSPAFRAVVDAMAQRGATADFALAWAGAGSTLDDSGLRTAMRGAPPAALRWTAPAWPAWAEISADYGFAAAEDSARTPAADGAQRQARTRPRPRVVREAKAEVPHARLAEMRAWIESIGAGPFRWTDPADGLAYADARIVGGAGGVTWRQAAGRGGAPRWRAELRIETSLPGAAPAGGGA